MSTSIPAIQAYRQLLRTVHHSELADPAAWFLTVQYASSDVDMTACMHAAFKGDFAAIGLAYGEIRAQFDVD